ncbi:Flp family type IVb pilin [Fulvimarina sp. 2208YS6-2-32]|uniref:Flp family type IVb pilin n=1 Tax=Fulvimarina uroteuthidis TaxID=3098149 RepID=A0ABU5I715_9HYPH|nr:Flp family type IVb pilin [Fulvimarina sp. 2208YS6-2-32]MDY8110543.1 Flp family type IVb pilin [Fulvimarina sp. 2208YS6-2-32]
MRSIVGTVRLPRRSPSAGAASKGCVADYRRCSSGATSIEYVLIAAIMSVATVSSMNALDLDTQFSATLARVVAALNGE